MKKFFLAFAAMLMALSVSAAEMSGTYKVGGEGADYATLKAACTALDDATLTGDVVLAICADLTEPVNIGIINTSEFNITIRPDQAVKRTITFTRTGDDNSGPSGSIIVGAKNDVAEDGKVITWAGLTPSKNITIDGSFEGEGRYLEIALANTGGGCLAAIGAVENIAFKNLAVINTKTSGTAHAIVVRDNQKVDPMVGPKNILIENCEVTSITSSGTCTGVNINCTKVAAEGLVLRGCDITAANRGVFMDGAKNLVIEGCTFSIPGKAGVMSDVVMPNTNCSGNHIFRGNKVVKLSTPAVAAGKGVRGVVASGGSWLIENNYFAGLDITAESTGADVMAQYVRAGGTCVIRHNTFYIPKFTASAGTSETAANPVTCINLASGNQTVENNIIISEETTTKNSLFRGSLPASTVKNNVYHIAGGNGFIVAYPTSVAPNAPTWADYETNFLEDSPAVYAEVAFADAANGDLSLTAANDKLLVPAIAEVTTDIAGTTRGAEKAYAGAFEYVAPVAPADTYVVAGVSALCGSEWNKTDENNLMTEANGVYTKVYTNVPVGKSYQLKVVKNGETWIGDATGNNITFHIIEACDVTVTFNPATSEITVTGTGVTFPTGLEIEAIYAAGNGAGNWLNGANWAADEAANKLTEVSPFVYQITYTGVPAGNYEVKFAANGAWTDSWGEVGDYTISSSIEDYDAAYNGGNIKINNTFAKADITLELDLSKFDYAAKSGAKFSVTITEQKVETPTEEVLATIVFKDSGKDSDGSNAKTAIADLIADGDEYVSDITKAEKIYNAKTGFGIKGGASSVKGELTLKLAKELKATKIVLHAAAYDEGKGIIVNGQEITLPTKDVLADHTITLDGTALSEIAIAGNANKARFYIHSLTIYGYPAAPVAATAVKLDKETAEVELYKSLQLTATLEPAEATNEITWKSSDDKIATVDARGLVTPVAVGEVTITATAAEGIEASCVVAVKEATVLTAAQAADIAKTVGANNELAPNGQYVVEAYVYSASELNTQFGNMELGLADSRDADTALLIAYRTIPADVENLPAVGDKVRVIGDLTKYNEKNQVAAGSKTTVIEKAPVPLSFELNGGTLAEVPADNAALWEAFKPAYNAYYATIVAGWSDRGNQAIDKVSTFAAAKMVNFMTDAASPWKWLGDYVMPISVAQGYALDATSGESAWCWTIHSFFNCSEAGTLAVKVAGFTEAGKPEAWVNAYKFGVAPTQAGYKFLGWFDNEKCEGTALTALPAGGTLYAGWEEIVVEYLSITPNYSELLAGDSILLTLVADPVGAVLGEITWSLVSGSELATIVPVAGTNTAWLKANADLTVGGQVEVKAAANGIETEPWAAVFAITIPVKAPESITITSETGKFEVEALGTLQLTATINPVGEYWYLWEISDDQLATISSTGLVTSLTKEGGKVTVTAKVEGFEDVQSSVEITLLPEETTGLDNVNVEVKTTKVLRDGQLIIIRGEEEYNVLGTKLQ